MHKGERVQTTEQTNQQANLLAHQKLSSSIPLPFTLQPFHPKIETDSPDT